MDDLDLRIANALNQVQNQKPVPTKGKRKNNKRADDSQDTSSAESGISATASASASASVSASASLDIDVEKESNDLFASLMGDSPLHVSPEDYRGGVAELDFFESSNSPAAAAAAAETIAASSASVSALATSSSPAVETQQQIVSNTSTTSSASRSYGRPRGGSQDLFGKSLTSESKQQRRLNGGSVISSINGNGRGGFTDGGERGLGKDEEPVRRPSFISGMEAETVSYMSTYTGRHISPSVSTSRENISRSSSSSSPLTVQQNTQTGSNNNESVPRMNIKTTSPMTSRNTIPTYSTRDCNSTMSGGDISSLPPVLEQSGVSAQNSGPPSRDPCSSGTAAEQERDQTNKMRISSLEFSEITAEKYYKNKLGANLAQELMDKIGLIEQEREWSLNRPSNDNDNNIDAAGTIGTGTGTGAFSRDAYVPLDRDRRIIRTDNIQVAIRVRPFNDEEKQAQVRRCVSLCGSDMSHRKLLLVNPSVPVFEVDQLAEAVDAEASFSKDIATVHTFDEMIWSAEPTRGTNNNPIAGTQEDMYVKIGKNLVEKALNGISSVCACYGEAKSGKTHTMYGNIGSASPSATGVEQPTAAAADNVGLLPRVFAEIVHAAQALGDTKCTLSFVEVYNEKLHDLLGNSGNDVIPAVAGHKHAQLGRHIHGGVQGALAAEYQAIDYRRNSHTAHSHSQSKLQPTHKDNDARHKNSQVFRSTHHRRNHTKLELKVREHPLMGPYVDGMRLVCVRSNADVLAVVQEAQAERQWLHEKAGTKPNYGTVLATLELTPLHDPSRHAKDSGGLQRAQRNVRIHMVDLAAAPNESVSNWRTSVRTASKPNSHGKEQSKVINVNMSGSSSVNVLRSQDEVKVVRRGLTHLNYILHSLERGALMHMLPFRDSVLTWLLRSTLILPSSCINMLAHVAPGDRSYEETCRSVKYAERLCTGRLQRNYNYSSRVGMTQNWAPEDVVWQSGNPATTTPTTMRSSNGNSGNSRRKFHNSSSSPTMEGENRPRFNTSVKSQRHNGTAIMTTNSGSPGSSGKRGCGGPNSNSNSNTGTSGNTSKKLERNFFAAAAAAEAVRIPSPWPSQIQQQEHEQEQEHHVSNMESAYPSVSAPALVTLSAKDSSDVAALKNVVLALQEALDQSLAEKKTLTAHNVTLQESLNSTTTALELMQASEDRAVFWRKSCSGNFNSNSNDNDNETQAELQFARADAAAAHEALNAFRGDAQRQLDTLWASVNELNKIDVSKEQAIAALVIERGQLANQLKQANIRSKALEEELELMDSVLLEASGVEINSDVSAPQQQPIRNVALQAHVPVPKPIPSVPTSSNRYSQDTVSSANHHASQDIVERVLHQHQQEYAAHDSPTKNPTAAGAGEGGKGLNFSTPSHVMSPLTTGGGVGGGQFDYQISAGPDSPEVDSPVVASTSSSASAASGSGSSSGSGTPRSKGVLRPFNNADSSVSACVSTSSSESAALDTMGDLELDEQIAKLSKYLVHDKRAIKLQHVKTTQQHYSAKNSPAGK